MSLEWLLDKGGPVVKYKTLTELTSVTDYTILHDLSNAILDLPQTQKRLTMLKNLDFNRVHGSDNTYLENVVPMLCDFGLNYNIDSFRSVSVQASDIFLNSYSYYEKIEVCPFLLYAKYPINALMDIAIERINTIYGFTKNMDFDIYDDPENHKTMPKPFRDRPVIKTSIVYGNYCRLPMIYDILMLAEVYDKASADLKSNLN